jgi:hypothetical protein
MAKQLSAKARAKQEDDRISRLYTASCNGVQIPMMSIPKIFQIGRVGIAEGLDDAALQAKIVEFVQTIRRN